MSSRFCASIRIGGPIRGLKIEPLLKAIREAAVSLEWGDAAFLPQNTDELMQARGEKWLFFCDEQADHGEFPELEATCRKLRLGYIRHSESSFNADAESVDWRPGMKKPLARFGSNINSRDTYIPTEGARKVLCDLQAGRTEKALRGLQKLCPDVVELPGFEIV
jgi:hypothetical protein